MTLSAVSADSRGGLPDEEERNARFEGFSWASLMCRPVPGETRNLGFNSAAEAARDSMGLGPRSIELSPGAAEYRPACRGEHELMVSPQPVAQA